MVSSVFQSLITFQIPSPPMQAHLPLPRDFCAMSPVGLYICCSLLFSTLGHYCEISRTLLFPPFPILHPWNPSHSRRTAPSTSSQPYKMLVLQELGPHSGSSASSWSSPPKTLLHSTSIVTSNIPTPSPLRLYISHLNPAQEPIPALPFFAARLGFQYSSSEAGSWGFTTMVTSL